ncbi:hypothetical protein GDO86_017559 [Hymenochirus boettgeri]|uniref:SMP-LTD domain-containing protein n=1 Tax=Hymenochirus boettgeri TaxID=247094 RepID=A0A8T2IQF7_9PIPI|nr:hypothetical protein GDO86_017559 [Hymenochirus boettgeri]
MMSYSSNLSGVHTGPSGPASSLPSTTKAAKMPQGSQGITIQLTKVHSEDHWEDFDETDLIFTLDQDNDAETAKTTERLLNSVCTPSSGSHGDVVNELALAAYECAGDMLLCSDVQRSSSPVRQGSPTFKPNINLVKSLSTEIDSKIPSPHKPHPLVNLVKSISTEISRLEPEVTQSKSDSKLNVHLWRQITQPKNKNGDSRTAPSSPSMSPSESKGLFFNVQEVEAKLEDTKRRLSEAMQEPLSMLNFIQVVEVASNEYAENQDSMTPKDKHATSNNYSDIPFSALFFLTILVYNFLLWPLPVYISGLFAGLAGGLLLGFFTILYLVPQQSHSFRNRQFLREELKSPLLTPRTQEPDVLKGWMNEISSYDPETYHPAFTNSVFVTLEGTTLKRSYPKWNLPRRSIFGEEIPEVVFFSHQVNELTNAQIFLYPHGLARKRLWNKKYPICIQLYDHDKESPSILNTGGMDDVSAEVTKLKPENTNKQSEPVTINTLFLFGRTGREKEEWYQRLVRAARGFTNMRQNGSKSESKIGFPLHTVPSTSNFPVPCNGIEESSEDISGLSKPKELAGNIKQKILLDYSAYMSHFIPTDHASPIQSPCQSAASSPTPRKKHLVERSVSNNIHVCWMNALIGRIFWDFLREKYWEDMVANKIQKKLSKIKLPHFMNELTLTELDMGTSLPQINSTSMPTMNERGLWIDLDVSYSGFLQITLETKMNLTRLGKETAMEEGRQPEERRDGEHTARAKIFVDSDEESSSAGSSEDEEIPITELAVGTGDRFTPTNSEGFSGGNRTGRKILRFVDKIAKSRYFQKATENEYIKRKMEEVSNTPLLLTVEVQELEGTLAINVPPPPTDRIWYSFRVPPRLEMRVRPKLGDREVTFIHVTEWIEKKLQDEFQKILVMPNMDDLYFPIMQSDVESSKPPHPEPLKPTYP